MIQVPLNLWRGDGSRPAGARCDRVPSPGAGRHHEDHHDHGHHHRRPAQERKRARGRRQVPRLADGVEGGQKLGDRGEPVVTRLREAPTHEVRQSRRHVPVHVREVWRLQRQDGVQGLERALSLERPAAGEHLVEHGTEREDVRASIDDLAAHLLRCHVASGAGDERARDRGRSFSRG